MRTILESPLGHMAAYPKFEMEVELSGGHHRQLLQGNKNQFEKVAAGVIQDLMGPKYDVYRMALPELFYTFFVAKASSLGPTWKFDWQCPAIKIHNHQEIRCGHKNEASYDLRKTPPTQLDRKFAFAKRVIRLSPVDGIEATGDAKCSLHVLSLTEEFQTIDDFLGVGETRERLLAEKAYDIYIRRIATALDIDHPEWVLATAVQKEALLDANPMKLKQELLQEMTKIDNVGFPLEAKSVCEGCGTEVTLRLPFLAGFVVRS